VAKSARFRIRAVDLVIFHHHHQAEVHAKRRGRINLSTTRAHCQVIGPCFNMGSVSRRLPCHAPVIGLGSGSVASADPRNIVRLRQPDQLASPAVQDLPAFRSARPPQAIDLPFGRLPTRPRGALIGWPLLSSSCRPNRRRRFRRRPAAIRRSRSPIAAALSPSSRAELADIHPGRTSSSLIAATLSPADGRARRDIHFIDDLERRPGRRPARDLKLGSNAGASRPRD
jgi:hypothetical protein